MHDSASPPLRSARVHERAGRTARLRLGGKAGRRLPPAVSRSMFPKALPHEMGTPTSGAGAVARPSGVVPPTLPLKPAYVTRCEACDAPSRSARGQGRGGRWGRRLGSEGLGARGLTSAMVKRCGRLGRFA
eukprot:354069-Chlamydomonas_euryale.AAC.13